MSSVVNKQNDNPYSDIDSDKEDTKHNKKKKKKDKKKHKHKKKHKRKDSEQDTSQNNMLDVLIDLADLDQLEKRKKLLQEQLQESPAKPKNTAETEDRNNVYSEIMKDLTENDSEVAKLIEECKMEALGDESGSRKDKKDRLRSESKSSRHRSRDYKDDDKKRSDSRDRHSKYSKYESQSSRRDRDKEDDKKRERLKQQEKDRPREKRIDREKERLPEKNDNLRNGRNDRKDLNKDKEKGRY